MTEQQKAPPKFSPYPRAFVARIPAPAGKKLSGTLIPRQIGFLAVKVTFHKEPCPGLEVKFSEADDEGKPGAQVGETTKTNKRGVAKVPYLVPAGIYVAEIKNQTPALISTVDDDRRPFVVVTPVDRPYFDLEEDLEFDEVDDEEVDDDDDEPAEKEGKPAGWVTIEALDGHGYPRKGARVQLIHEGEVIAEQVVGGDGRANFFGLPPADEYEVVITDGDDDHSCEAVDDGDDDADDDEGEPADDDADDDPDSPGC